MPHVRRFSRVIAQFLDAPARLAGLLVAVLGCAGCAGEIGEPASSSRSGTPAAGAGALPGTAAASGPTAQETKARDEAMRAANPSLFDTARTYFPNDTGTSAPKRLFRLTRTQLDVTTKALLPSHYMSTAVAALPRDPLQTNYEYAENLSFNAANFTPYTRWVEQLSASVRANPSSVIDCAAQSNAPSCLEEGAKKFTAKAFRGLAPEATLQRFSKFYAASVGQVGFADATAELVDLTLTSPQYVYRDEVQATGGVLSAAQQLQNISYTLADAPPDAVGLPSSAAATQLSGANALQQTIDKVLATPAAREKLLRFFISWLEVKEPDEFTIATEVFPEFTPAVAAAAVEETRAFLNHQLAGAAPKLKDVTQSTQSFVSEALAAIYGQKSRAKSGLVDLDPAQRLGIFTQPAVIASHSGPTTTRLVKRGVFFTRKVMCLPLGLPPPGVNTTLPPAENTTERKRVESATANATCQGCHSFINPFGFMQENYDAIGRWRTTDDGQPIDPSVRVEFLDEGPLVARTPIDALKGLTASARFQQCFARQLFRFYMGRDEAAGDDPVLREMFFGFANRGEQDIVSMLKILARSASFSQRSEKP